jgi:integrase
MAVLAVSNARRVRDWLMWLLTYRHALRISETLNLTRADVEGGHIIARRLKGSETTIQPLLEHPDPLLNERIAVPLFVRNLTEKQKLFTIKPRRAEYAFAGYAAAVGIPAHKRHPHVLKHTCLTELVPKIGVPAAQCWAGHKSGASTLMYTRMDPAMVAEAVRTALTSGI